MNKYIMCGECGLFGTVHDTSDGTTGNCRQCGADHWLEWADFGNPELTKYCNDIAAHFNMEIGKFYDLFRLKARCYPGDKALATLKEFDEYLEGGNDIKGGSIYHERIKRLLEDAGIYKVGKFTDAA